MKIGLALRELHRSERKLARTLHVIAARHQTESQIHYIALDLAHWSENHLRDLSEHSQRYGVDLSAHPRTRVPGASRQASLAHALRRRPEPALMLLADLRQIHRLAAGVSLDWELVGQASQATKDDALHKLTSRCHPQTLRQMRWANAMLKELSPQILTS